MLSIGLQNSGCGDGASPTIFWHHPCGSGSADAVVEHPVIQSLDRSGLPEDLRFQVLRLLERQPELSQREIARELGIALGRVNFVLNALIDKGLVKAHNFRTARNKLRYAYLLTPQGLADRSRLTAGFLLRKLAEYDALTAEIEALRRELHEAHAAKRIVDRF
jgi:EPS-associated MarR family transcriptional regulator